jgi:oxygen-independent coproporphyrinogen-3 oxidase
VDCSSSGLGPPEGVEETSGGRAFPHGPAPVAHWLRPGTLTLAALPPLSLYVHLPWCLKKCPYCDFNSHQAKADPPFARDLDALRCDLEASLPLVWGRRVVSVFIGGGTPSLFAPAAIDRLLGDVRALLPLEAGCEITLEANPGTFERERFRGYRDAGVTRLSVGVQSFDDSALAALGRVHDAAQARAALAEAREVFETFNIDLMYALPGQTPAALDADLRAALDFEPPHLSIYQLTIEPNTLFAKHPPALPDDDCASDMLDLITERCAAAGLARYEVSAYARPGHHCRHNLNYWEFGDYLGIGAGAHGKLSSATRIWREARERHPNAYLDGIARGEAIAETREVGARELPFEFMMNALRLTEGFATPLFAERTGLALETIEPQLIAARQRGLIEADRTHIRPTVAGQRFLNDLLQIFLDNDT